MIIQYSTYRFQLNHETQTPTSLKHPNKIYKCTTQKYQTKKQLMNMSGFNFLCIIHAYRVQYRTNNIGKIRLISKFFCNASNGDFITQYMIFHNRVYVA